MKYDKLNNFKKPDTERLRQFCALHSEVRALKKEYDRLSDILSENTDLLDFVWGDRFGGVTSIFELEDTHIQNILSGGFADGKPVGKNLKKLAIERGITYNQVQRIECPDYDEDYDEDFNF